MSSKIPTVPQYSGDDDVVASIVASLNKTADHLSQFAGIFDANRSADSRVASAMQAEDTDDPAVVAWRKSDEKLAAQIARLTEQRKAQQAEVAAALRVSMVGETDPTAASEGYRTHYDKARKLTSAIVADAPEYGTWFDSVPSASKQAGRVVSEGKQSRPREINWNPPVTDATVNGAPVEFKGTNPTPGELAKVLSELSGAKVTRNAIVSKLLEVVGDRDAFNNDQTYTLPPLTINEREYVLTWRADASRLPKRERKAKSEAVAA